MKLANSRSVYQITAILVLTLIFLPAMAEETKPLEEKVAEVNGVIITNEQYSKELEIQRSRVSQQQQGAQISESQLTKMKNEVLEGLIEREVLYQESRKVGIEITEQKIGDQMAAIRNRFPDENEFKNALSRMSLTEEEMKVQIERGLAIRELIERQITRNVTVTDEESKAFYDGNPQFFKQPEQVKASHILIKAGADAGEPEKAEARKKIKEVQQKLKDGGDFAALAREYSEGPSNTSGGDLGFFRRGQMVKPFEDAAFAMEPNQVSDIVETRFGYHLIKVYEKKPEGVLAYTEVKDKLTQHLKQQKIDKEAVQYINQLKKDAKIEKFL
jgi:peptidyl-prolyl cis-trans isomerase C